MKLLFNDSHSIKHFLGFVDKDINFNNLKQDIITATREVIATISKDVYDLAVGAFEDSLDPTNEADLIYFLELVQHPIITKAYSLYAPSNDLSHTNDGRKMRNEDHEKNAFEWMINADNAAQEKRYYRALNDLLIYLNESNLSEWLSSDEYKKVNKLFVNSLEKFNDYHPLDSLLLLHKLNPGLSQCERREIISRIGKEKFEQLKNTPAEDDDYLIELIKEACVNFSLAHMIPKLSINLLPDGILQSFTSDRATTKATKPAQFLEKEIAVQSFTQAFNRAVFDIEKLMQQPLEPNENQTPINPTNNTNQLYFTT